MDITEMHLYIDLELNKLNSNLYEIILPEEKDYFLNRAQERFVKTRYSAMSNPKRQGFEMTEKRIDDLRRLLVPNYYDYALVLPSTDFDYETKLRFYFPDDYMLLTSSRSKLTHNHCGVLTPILNTEIVNISALNIPNVESYAGLTVTVDVTSVPLPLLATLTNKDKSIALQYILDTLNAAGIADWNFYSSYRGTIADIVGVKTSFGNITLVVDSIPLVDKDTVEISYEYLTATGNREVSPNRFAQQDDVYIMAVDPFNKTNAFEGPLTIIQTDSIDVFYDPNSFIVNQIAISYIRKPKLMSSIINQSCELSDETHSEIVRDAVNLLLETMEATGRLQSSLGVEQTNE